MSTDVPTRHAGEVYTKTTMLVCFLNLLPCFRVDLLKWLWSFASQSIQAETLMVSVFFFVCFFKRMTGVGQVAVQKCPSWPHPETANETILYVLFRVTIIRLQHCVVLQECGARKAGPWFPRRPRISEAI